MWTLEDNLSKSVLSFHLVSSGDGAQATSVSSKLVYRWSILHTLQNGYTVECLLPRNLLINFAFLLRKVSHESKAGSSAKSQSRQQALDSGAIN